MPRDAFYPSSTGPRPESAAVLGIDLGGTKLHVALADLHGEIAAEIVEPTAGAGGAAVVAQIGRLSDGLLRIAGSSRECLKAATMGCPGIVDPASGSIAMAPNIAGLDRLDLPAELRRRLGVAVAIDNDVNLAAFGEHWSGCARDAQSFVFVALGTGIGMGLFSDGRLIRGARGAAGEIAYLPLGGDPFDRQAQRLGTLETAIGSAGIVARHAALGGTPGLTVRDIFDRIDREAAAEAVIDEVGRVLATAILAVHSLIDPEIVVLGGSIGARPELEARIAVHLAACMAEPARIAISALGSRATMVGAIGSALAAARKDAALGGP